MSDAITLPDAPEPFPGNDAPEVPPAVGEAIDPYADYSEESRLILSKLDTIILELAELKGYAAHTNNGVNWIGTNFQNLLNTVSQLGAHGPIGLLKMMKGGAS